jgi:hypothetical protein
MYRESIREGATVHRAPSRGARMLVLALLIGALGAPPCRADEGAASLYRRYCAACHGIQGFGNGPAAPALQPPPTDLTTLDADVAAIMRSIDGRRTVRAHGDSQMPVWGEVFEQSYAGKPYPRQTTLRQVEALAEYVVRLRRKLPTTGS